MLTRAARPRRAVAVVLTLTALAAVACAPKSQKEGASSDSSKDDAPTTTFAFPDDEVVDLTGQATVTIAAQDNIMEPRYVEITAGTKVTFTNEGRNPHDLVPAVDDAFEGVDQKDFGPGRAHTVTFTDPGDFPYYCSVHGTMKNGMNGAIRVVPA